MKIKICGITNLDDALAAAESGADMLGFNFYPKSARYITPLACAQLQGALAARGLDVITVGVFVNTPVAAIAAILDDCALDLAQLHGAEPPEDLFALEERAFKGLQLFDTSSAQVQAARYARGAPPALLVDAASKTGQLGGTGEIANWDVAAILAARYPLFLAGGLRPENVAAAIRRVRPWGVDVASGVENSPGRKDPALMTAFVRAARAAAEGIEIE